MKSKLFSAAAAFALIIAALAGVFCFFSQSTDPDEQMSENLVALNELYSLPRMEKAHRLRKKHSSCVKA